MNRAGRVWMFFRDDARAMGQVLLLVIAGVLLNVLKPWPLAYIVDEVLDARANPRFSFGPFGIVTDRAELIFYLALAVVGLHFLAGAMAAAHNYYSIRIGLAGLRRVREEVFAALQRLSMRFHSGKKAGDLIQRAAWDTYAFQTLFQQGVVTTVTAALTLVFMLVVMARTNGALTLIALVIAPLLYLVLRFFGREMAQRGAEAQQADSEVTSAVQQSLAAKPLTLSYTMEEAQAREFRMQTFHAQERRLAQHGWEVMYWLGVTLVFGLGTALLTWAGAHQVLKQQLTVGELLVFLAYLAQLYEPINQLAHVGSTVATAGAAANRVFEILDAPEEVKDAPDARPVVRATPPSVAGVTHRTGRTGVITKSTLLVRGALAFDNVSFA
ncbi:MAG: ABC transporter ATP-binding protein, partial [Verrucomicrobia bacterium]|nr:ABC transporter ATP-binding protein [Verrucomicrobiota bacterium]